jgi:hypothetical protein
MVKFNTISSYENTVEGEKALKGDLNFRSFIKFPVKHAIYYESKPEQHKSSTQY